MRPKMAEFMDFVEGLTNFQGNIAHDVFGDKNWQLKCKKCGRIVPISTQEAGKYLQTGWPKCHDHTMTLEEVLDSQN